MHTIPHTLIRDGKYFYNRRVPVKAQNRYGRLIRFRIGSDPQVVELVAVRITDLLSRSFNDGTVLDYKAIAESLRPKEEKYSYWLEEYLELRRIAPKPPTAGAKHAIKDKIANFFIRSAIVVSINFYLSCSWREVHFKILGK